MCEDCERGDKLMVVYSRKIDRRGWRPPARAATVARHRDADGAAGTSSRLLCESSRPKDRRREVR